MHVMCYLCFFLKFGIVIIANEKFLCISKYWDFKTSIVETSIGSY